MKRILSVFMIFVLICLLSVAVFAEGESIVGRTFTLTDEEEGVMELTIVDETSCTMHVKFKAGDTADLTGTYTLSGDIITVYSAGEEFGDLRIVGDTLEYVEDDDYAEPVESTLFDRVWDWIIAHRNTILEIITLICLMLLRKKTNKVNTSVEANTSGNATVIESNNGMVGVMNTMIEGYNKFKEDTDNNKAAEERRDKQIAALTVAVMANLEILSRVYPNSKNLPQGVKDVVNMTYANAMNAISNDEQLTALVTASKGLLAAGTEKAASEEETEVTV